MTDHVFLKASKPKTSNYAGLPILYLTGVSRKDGEIGIEIEVEGNKFPKSNGHQHSDSDPALIPKKWKFTNDGSLRGEDNAEYVLVKPLNFSEVEGAINDLWEMFRQYGSVLSESNRTSVHVHLNVQNWYINRLCSFVSMYFVVEELLTAWCGDHRVGNLFCLRGRDAPAIIRRLKEFFQKDGYGYEFSSGMHYAGLNPSALHKFGSVEIRSLRGVNDPKVILDWVGILERLYTLSADFKDPREVVSGFSGAGPIAWLQNILGDKFSTVMQGVPYTTDEVRDILYNGIRLAQDLCYCREWSDFEEKKVEENPFGRKAKIAAGLFNESPPPPVNTIYTSLSSLSSGSVTVSGAGGGNGQSQYYATSVLIEKVTQLKSHGLISALSYNSLLGSPPRDIEQWLIVRGYLEDPYAPEQDESEDWVDEDEDYGE